MTSAIDAQASAEAIVRLEYDALDRWGHGDPGGLLELYAPEVTYFDPTTPARIDGRDAMAAYYAPWIGKIRIARFEMLNPHIVVDGNMAVFTYNLVNYVTDPDGVEVAGTRWNSTTVYHRRGGNWKAIHSHWSFTSHPAFQAMTPESSESQPG